MVQEEESPVDVRLAVHLLHGYRDDVRIRLSIDQHPSILGPIQQM